MKLRPILIATILGIVCSVSSADIAIYTVKDFRSITPRPAETYQITGFIVDLYECPPCPREAVCATCPWEYIIISDSPHKTKEDDSPDELKILLRRNGTEGLKRWTKMLFTVRNSEWDPNLDLISFKKFSPEDVDDLSIEIKETVCSDDSELFDCKPRIMKAIETGDFDLVKKIVESGVDVNTAYPSYYGKTALMHAVDEGEEKIALYLLEQGADPGVRVPMDPLTEAEAQGLTEAAQKMKKLRGPNTK
ncbi:MAG: ankyrin repeat domain-containing protein [Candidatus Omnitrophota bacterium]|nr:ankyrin repeat domain-containing protein [Candidatus Omnitrophota bacterium]